MCRCRQNAAQPMRDCCFDERGLLTIRLQVLGNQCIVSGIWRESTLIVKVLRVAILLGLFLFLPQGAEAAEARVIHGIQAPEILYHWTSHHGLSFMGRVLEQTGAFPLKT